MKNVLILVGALVISGVTFGQCNEKKRFTTGFNLGVNHANLLLDDATQGTLDNGIGLRLGLISDFAFSNRFSLQPKAEVAFNNIKFRDGVQNIAVNPANLELMTHLKVRVKTKPSSFYFLAGPNLSIPLGNNQNALLTRNDVALDLGAGFDLGIGKIRISPELRYSIGLTNLSQSENLSDLHFHNVSLLLNFAKKPRL